MISLPSLVMESRCMVEVVAVTISWREGLEYSTAA
jgi:hypothetical protein